MQFIPSETLVIDRKRRANMPFYDLDLRPPVERICDFGDVVIDFSSERAMAEAARCAVPALVRRRLRSIADRRERNDAKHI